MEDGSSGGMELVVDLWDDCDESSDDEPVQNYRVVHVARARLSIPSPFRHNHETVVLDGWHACDYPTGEVLWGVFVRVHVRVEGGKRQVPKLEEQDKMVMDSFGFAVDERWVGEWQHLSSLAGLREREQTVRWDRHTR